jgi:hypothetical protein
MSTILVATGVGCRAYSYAGEVRIELAGQSVTALAGGSGNTCLAVIDEYEIWRRSAGGAWSFVTSTHVPLESILEVGTTIYGGSSLDAALVRLTFDAKVDDGREDRGKEERLVGLDRVEGRAEWFAGGPPLGVRALTATADGAAILAAVHVGGIPRSSDGGETWCPTLPIAYDVHEVVAHAIVPTLAAAATAVGLCVSRDGGQSWAVLDEGLEITNSLAVAMLPDEVLFSVQEGPFAARSQVWRWRMGGDGLEVVSDGLPEWLDGKVDTGRIGVGGGRAVIADGGGNLWLSAAGSRGWQRIAMGVPYGTGILIV